MNEEPCTQKKFTEIIARQKELSQERDKLILEIHNILDRIFVDRPTANKDPKGCVANPMVKQTFLADMNDITGDMRIANESLIQAVNRLNDLI